jgi:transposase
MEQNITFVGLDVSKSKIAVAIAEAGRRGEVRFWGTIANDPVAVERLVEKLAARHASLRFCYEAGPFGYGLYRQLAGLGHACDVVAPSLIPSRPGERVKTDRRDGIKLAKLNRAGELTSIWVPDETHEAMRDLVRARGAAVSDLRRARLQCQSFLLRHGRVFSAAGSWTRRHRDWLRRQHFAHPAQRIVLEELLQAIAAAEERLERLEGQIRELVSSWSLAPQVELMQALRGIALIGAATIGAELGDLRRFASPKQLMAYLGLIPSEYSSGERRHRGPITKAGNIRVRTVLVEGAWSYRLPAQISNVKQRRLQHLPKPVREIAWKAQTRLCQRHRRLVARGKPSNLVTVAVAREMAAFLWAIAQHTPATAGAAPADGCGQG